IALPASGRHYRSGLQQFHPRCLSFLIVVGASRCRPAAGTTDQDSSSSIHAASAFSSWAAAVSRSRPITAMLACRA
ncbi:hypothetical protein, partial [Stenotrophomonas maltophilia]|uniref:hypothetical protein n=1 Tax=Stenotrophomonas maltophilia TaxID=40324 RepID=UPI001C610884